MRCALLHQSIPPEDEVLCRVLWTVLYPSVYLEGPDCVVGLDHTGGELGGGEEGEGEPGGEGGQLLVLQEGCCQGTSSTSSQGVGQ